MVGEPGCRTGAYERSGRVYAFTRLGSGWSLSQTIESPEAQTQNGFGNAVALSDDGKSATVAIGLRGRELKSSAGAAWVLEYSTGSWHARSRLTAPPSEEGAGFSCPIVVGSAVRIVCTADDAVGFDGRQGSIYLFERPKAGWGSPVGSPQRLFATEGAPADALGSAMTQELTTTANGGVIDATVSSVNLANGTYPEDRVGYEFTVPSVP